MQCWKPLFFKWVKIWLQVSGMCMCVIYCTCLQRRSMCIRWAPTRLLCQSCAQALLVHTRVGAVGILAARQPPWRPSIDHLQGQKDMYLSIEIITPTVQPSCTGNVFYYLAKRREMWGGGKVMRERREKNHWYMKRKRWHNIWYMSRGIFTPGKK